MHIRQFTLAAALLALPAMAARAQDVPPAPPNASVLSAPAAQPVTLRFKFAPGQVRRYKIVVDVNGTLGAGPSGAAMPLKNHMEMTLTQTVKDVRASDGAATLASRTDLAAMTLNGVPVSDAMKAQLQHTITTVITPEGKVLSAQVDGSAGAALPGMDFSSIGLSQTGGSLPAGLVKVGDTWKSITDVAMMQMQVQTASTLTGVDTTGGKNIANVTQTIRGTASPSAPPNAALPMQMTGTITGTVTKKFDLNAGALLSQNSAISMTMTMTPQKTAEGATPATTGATKIQLQTTSSMTRLDDDAPTP